VTEPFRSIVVLVLLTGCASQLETPPETAEVVTDALPETTEVAATWAVPAGDTGEVDDDWLKTFNDRELEALVDEALREHNPNLRLLAAQVDRANAAARLAGAALQPTVALGADVSGVSGTQSGSSSSAGAGVALSWEADVWGRVQAGAQAAEENLRASVADFEFARQSIAANVAKTWYLATELNQQRLLARALVELLAEMVVLVETKERVGQVAMQDVYLVRADLASSEDALRQAVAGQQQARRALEILLGRYPSGEIEGASDIPDRPPPIAAGIPADLIQRRPDLIAAERHVASAFFLTEEARLAQLPSFNLTVGAGGSSSMDELLGNLAVGMMAPLYTGGALEAQLDIATADQQAAIGAYGAQLLIAFEEVEGALLNEFLLAEREQFLRSAVSNNNEALKLARTQYDVGQIELLNVLQIQSRWIGSKVGLLRIRNEQLANRIDLHLSLGGSFDTSQD
jgi:NodT family efflux transporter outer membrane factor (OMF) lipoprotein